MNPVARRSLEALADALSAQVLWSAQGWRAEALPNGVLAAGPAGMQVQYTVEGIELSGLC